MARGRLFAVVGPSGAGKDTLLEAAARARPDLHLVRRTITRPESAGGEAFEGVSEAEFAARLATGGFALHWQAHGLFYGIPAMIDGLMDDGVSVVFNGSRGVIGEALKKYPDMQVILLTASPHILAARLATRGRETREDIERRLARASYALPEGVAVHEVVNDTTVEAALAQLLAVLQPTSA